MAEKHGTDQASPSKYAIVKQRLWTTLRGDFIHMGKPCVAVSFTLENFARQCHSYWKNLAGNVRVTLGAFFHATPPPPQPPPSQAKQVPFCGARLPLRSLGSPRCRWRTAAAVGSSSPPWRCSRSWWPWRAMRWKPRRNSC